MDFLLKVTLIRRSGPLDLIRDQRTALDQTLSALDSPTAWAAFGPQAE